jgi:hypothetical protein
MAASDRRLFCRPKGLPPLDPFRICLVRVSQAQTSTNWRKVSRHNICTAPALLKALANFYAEILNKIEAQMSFEEVQTLATKVAARHGRAITLARMDISGPSRAQTTK